MTAAYKTPQMTACSACGGYGMRMIGDGEPFECPECDAGAVEARDSRGRFLPWRTVPAEHDFAIREVVNGRIEIEGITYAPKGEYDGSLDGRRFAFGRYWTGDELARSHPDYLAFVCLWGTEREYEDGPDADDTLGTIEFEWWNEVPKGDTDE